MNKHEQLTIGKSFLSQQKADDGYTPYMREELRKAKAERAARLAAIADKVYAASEPTDNPDCHICDNPNINQHNRSGWCSACGRDIGWHLARPFDKHDLAAERSDYEEGCYERD